MNKRKRIVPRVPFISFRLTDDTTAEVCHATNGRASGRYTGGNVGFELDGREILFFRLLQSATRRERFVLARSTKVDERIGLQLLQSATKTRRNYEKV